MAMADCAECCREPLFSGPLAATYTGPKQDLSTEPIAGSSKRAKGSHADSIEFSCSLSLWTPFRKLRKLCCKLLNTDGLQKVSEWLSTNTLSEDAAECSTAESS